MERNAGVQVSRLRRPGMAALTAAVVLVAVLGVAGILWKYFDAEERREAAQKAEGLAEQRREAAQQAEALAKAETQRANEESDAKGRELTQIAGRAWGRSNLRDVLVSLDEHPVENFASNGFLQTENPDMAPFAAVLKRESKSGRESN